MTACGSETDKQLRREQGAAGGAGRSRLISESHAGVWLD
jgi:hypothetical protein